MVLGIMAAYIHVLSEKIKAFSHTYLPYKCYRTGMLSLKVDCGRHEL
jgi:hypothetical protein